MTSINSGPGRSSSSAPPLRRRGDARSTQVAEAVTFLKGWLMRQGTDPDDYALRTQVFETITLAEISLRAKRATEQA